MMDEALSHLEYRQVTSLLICQLLPLLLHLLINVNSVINIHFSEAIQEFHLRSHRG